MIFKMHLIYVFLQFNSPKALFASNGLLMHAVMTANVILYA